MADQPNSFWSSIPGILTGIAALITALTGLYIAINNNRPEIKSDTPNTNNTQSKQTGSDSKNSGGKTTDPSATASSSTVSVASNNSGDTQQNSARQRVIKPFAQAGLLVDCKLFPAVNSVHSLMSWSDYYHKQIISAAGVYARAREPCNKTIDYRGMAHCKAPDNMQVRQAFLETLRLCRAAGIEWQDIKHTKILTK